MSTNDRLALLALLVAMFLAPAIVAGVQQVPQKRPTRPTAVAAIAVVPSPVASATRYCTSTPMPTLGPTPGPTATIFELWVPTVNVWTQRPGYRALTPIPEREAVAWLAQAGQE